jgi:hypothetical protein
MTLTHKNRKSCKNKQKHNIIIGGDIAHYENGDIYDGEFQNNMRNGNGKMIYSNGDIYIGDWVNNKRQGHGKISFVFEDGDVVTYEGNWNNDVHANVGIITETNGDVYTGQLNDQDNANGKGSMDFENGDKYRGKWKNNQMEGQGSMIYANGDKYIGNWINNEKSGKGTMLYANNGDKYKGDWQQDKINGKGIIAYSNGHSYEGEFIDGLRYGRGIMLFANENKYSGDWVNNSIEGHGIMWYANGDEYNGDWHNDMRYGTGKMFYKVDNGYDEYNGEWVNDMRQGHGIFTYYNNVPFEGEWYEDEPEEIEEEDNELAYEIHRASAKINLDAYINIISVGLPNINYVDMNIIEYVRPKFIDYITANPFNDKETKMYKLNEILNKASGAIELMELPQNKVLIGKTVDFVFNQSNPFIQLYIESFIQDCYHAYKGQPGTTMSCIAGILERFYMLVGDTVASICEDTCDNEIYNELLKVFNKRADINTFTQEWSTLFLDNPENTELQDMSKLERKKHYIDFMQQKYRELDMLDEHTSRKIQEEADKIDYVFDSLQFGGNKKNKKTIKKHKIKTIKKHKIKTIKKHKIKTIKKHY